MADMAAAGAAGAGAVVTTAGAVVVAAIGVDPQALLWALIGAVIGLSFAPPAAWWRAVLLFLAVVMVCALFGTWASVEAFDGSTVARNAMAAGIAIVFHPMLAAAVSQAAAALAALRRRIGMGD